LNKNILDFGLMINNNILYVNKPIPNADIKFEETKSLVLFDNSYKNICAYSTYLKSNGIHTRLAVSVCRTIKTNLALYFNEGFIDHTDDKYVVINPLMDARRKVMRLFKVYGPMDHLNA
jgi:hypothetical protein